MSENEWINFSGLLLHCGPKCMNESCPFHKFYTLDDIRKLLLIASINESEAKQMLQTSPDLYNCCCPKETTGTFSPFTTVL